MAKKKASLISASDSNMNYIIVIAVILCMIAFCVAITIHRFKETAAIESSNYDITYKFNGYYIKLTNAAYNSESQDFSFDIFYKQRTVTANTEPQIYSISSSENLEQFKQYVASELENNDYGKHIVVKDVPGSVQYVRIYLESTTPEHKLPDKKDDFGNVIEGELVKATTVYSCIIINLSDANKKQIAPDGVVTTTPFEPETTDFEATSFFESTITPSEKNPEPTNPTKSTTTTTAPTVTTTTEPTTTTTEKKTITSKKATTTAKQTTTTTTEKKTTTTAKKTTMTTTTTVFDVFPTGLKITCPQASNGIVTLSVGSTAQLTAVFTPSNTTNQHVAWTSNRTDRVTVNSNGKVTAVGTGSAIIQCTNDDGTFSAAIMVTVR